MVFGEPPWKSKESGSAKFESGSILAPESIEKPDKQNSEDKEEHERRGIAVSIYWPLRMELKCIGWGLFHRCCPLLLDASATVLERLSVFQSL